MAESKEFIVGLLIMTILTSGIVIVELTDQVRIRIDEDKATMYVPHETMHWIWVVGGREYSRLFDGTKQLNRDKSSIEINYLVNGYQTIILRQTGYQRGPIIIESWFFDGRQSDVELFPIRHTVEVINASGFFYRYSVDDLVDAPPKYKLSGETSLSFGRNMKVELHPGYRWAWIGYPYGSDSVAAQYDIKSDYEVFNMRLYDPPGGECTCDTETPGLYINYSSTSAVIEQGSPVCICAIADVETEDTCVNFDHGEYGLNYSCGLNFTAFEWNSSSNVRKFNDSSLYQDENYTSVGTYNLTIYPIYNDSEIESFYLDLAGVASENYTQDVKIDYLNDSIWDWVSWGELQLTQTKASYFNDSSPNMTASFQGRGTASVYLKLPKNDMNVSYAVLNLTGAVNHYSQKDLFIDWLIGDPDSDPLEHVKVVRPVCDHRDGTDDVYCFGGQEVGGLCGLSQGFNCSFQYDVDGGANSLSMNDNTTIAFWLGGVVYSPTDDVFYLFGGYDGSDADTVNVLMQEYDPDTNVYTSQTNVPQGRVGAQYAFVPDDDRILICGGYYNNGGSLSTNKSCYIYDVSTDTYNLTIADPPDRMEVGWMEVFGPEEMIMFGGTRAGAASGGRTYIYNITENTWRTGGSLPAFPYGMSGVEFGGEVYSWGGWENPPAFNTIVRWYNETLDDWMDIESADYEYSGTSSTWETIYTSCVEVERSTGEDGYICTFDGNGYSPFHRKGWFLPNKITMVVEDYATPSYTGSSDLETTVTVGDFSDEINDQLSRCTANVEGYCDLRLVFTNYGSGLIVAQALNITTPLPRISLGGFNVSCETDWCETTLAVYGGSQGMFNITNLSINYLGTSNITITRLDSDASTSNLSAEIYYSDYDYTLPQNYDYLEFIPSTPTSENVTPYGQTPVKPILNITTLNTGGRNMSWYFLLDDNVNLSCVNLTASNVANDKDTGNLLINGTWYRYENDIGPGNNFGLWMWADYTCNFTTWKMWQPNFYFRGCAEDSVCSEEYP